MSKIHAGMMFHLHLTSDCGKVYEFFPTDGGKEWKIHRFSSPTSRNWFPLWNYINELACFNGAEIFIILVIGNPSDGLALDRNPQSDTKGNLALAIGPSDIWLWQLAHIGTVVAFCIILEHLNFLKVKDLLSPWLKTHNWWSLKMLVDLIAVKDWQEIRS